MSNKVAWTGASGTPYQYWFYPIHTELKDEPGNYILARVNGSRWEALYIGQTQNLKERIGPGHHRWDCAKRYGATHIHAHTSSHNEADRSREESDLIRSNNPYCNQQGVR